MNTNLTPRADQSEHGGLGSHTPGRRPGHRSRGVSLIEALVALAVMAFGLLGVVGMQTTLRFNADVSRQRAEAVRLAQEKMESMRSFGVLSGAPVTEHDYNDIVSSPAPEVINPPLSNATFTRTVTVTPPATGDDPLMKTIEVTVSWLDRRTASGGSGETVQLRSTIAEVAPILGATLGLPGDRAGPQRPFERHLSIPPGAVDIGGGKSRFAPPGALPGYSWTFVNATGKIVEICSAGMPPNCAAAPGLLLSGFIRFIPKSQQPSPLLAEAPPSISFSDYPENEVTVELSAPVPALVSPRCFVTPLFSPLGLLEARIYFCFVPVDPASPSWSGRSVLRGFAFEALISQSRSDATPTNIKVCRYTPEDMHVLQPSEGNVAHPLYYVGVKTSLTNQNFLVHSAGGVDANGVSVAWDCSDDFVPVPDNLINTNTFAHQPPN